MVKAMVLTKQGSPRDLEMLDFPSPKPGKGDIVADVELCGICGTDTHQVYGMLNFPTPNIIGHEWFGRVRELGEDGGIDALGGELRKGDRIATSIGVSRKDWYARNVPERQNISQGFEEVGIPMDRTSDDPPHLWGAFFEQVYLPSYLPVYKFPPGLEDREMVLVEPVAVPYFSSNEAQADMTNLSIIEAPSAPTDTHFGGNHTRNRKIERAAATPAIPPATARVRDSAITRKNTSTRRAPMERSSPISRWRS